MKRFFVCILIFSCWGIITQLHAEPMPVSGSLYFTLQPYTSLYDCEALGMDIENDREACKQAQQDGQFIALLPQMQPNTKAHHPNARPMLFSFAEIQTCDNHDKCHPLKSVPWLPHHDYRPELVFSGNTMIYYKPFSFADHYRLVISLKGIEWKSDIMCNFFHNDFFDVSFSDEKPGQLLLMRDWSRTLTDEWNYHASISLVEICLLLWLSLIFIELCALAGFMLFRMQSWEKSKQLLMVHAFTLVIALGISLLLNLTDKSVMFIFIGSLAVDAWLLQHYAVYDWLTGGLWSCVIKIIAYVLFPWLFVHFLL